MIKNKLFGIIGGALMGLALAGALFPEPLRWHFLTALLVAGIICVGVSIFKK